MSEDFDPAIMMACLNEVLTVGDCAAEARAYLDKAGSAGEVLVADNGSTDGSQEERGAARQVSPKA